MKALSPRILLAVLLLSIPVISEAKGKESKKVYYGVKGGYNYSNVSGVRDVENLSLSGYSGFNVGGFIRWNLPLMFALQPEILYYQEGVKTDLTLGGSGKTVGGKLYNGNIYIPINLQWGPEVGIFRFYAQVAPFIGFNLYNRFKYRDDLGTHIEVLTRDSRCFMGGIGLGIGIDIGRVYISAKYNWNFNRLFSDVPAMLDANLANAKMRGLEVSLGFGF